MTYFFVNVKCFVFVDGRIANMHIYLYVYIYVYCILYVYLYIYIYIFQFKAAKVGDVYILNEN